MKTKLVFLLILPSLLFSQLTKIENPDYHADSEMYTDGKLLYTNAITIQFDQIVLDLPEGQIETLLDAIPGQFATLHSELMQLRAKYGFFKFEKLVPSAKPGDTRRINKRTGAPVVVPDLSQMFTLKFENPVPIGSVIAELHKIPEIKRVRRPGYYRNFASPNDEKYVQGLQWGLSAVSSSQAWDITKGSTNIRIAVIDEGIKQDHVDLTGKFVGGTGGFNPTLPHGTWVAGVAGANTDNNQIGVASLGWNIKLSNYDKVGQISAEDAIYRAGDSADVISISWGRFGPATLADIPGTCPNPSNYIPPKIGHAQLPYPDEFLEEAINYALQQGVVCIASAGNVSQNEVRGVPPECDPAPVPYESYPAAFDGVIAVSGTELASGTEQFIEIFNYGYFVDVSGPAWDILTTNWDGGYASVNGTSFSAPLVAALAGLVLSVNPTITPAQMHTILTASADKIGQYQYVNGRNDYMGYGRINAYKALKYTLENYGGTLTQSFTIPSGETWNFQEGVSINFATGKSLTVNGTLNAYETTFYFANSNPFSGSGKLIVNGTLSASNTLFSSSAHWGGIYFASGSDGYMNECMVSNVEVYGGAAITINNANPYIEYSTIENNIGDCSGISMTSDASVGLRYNTIRNNSRHGIRMYDAWAGLQYNNITGTTGTGKAAVMIDGLSSPLFGATSSPFEGKNTLTGGYYGIAATYYSSPTVGGSSSGRNNRLFGNSYADAWANYNSTIYATYDWWGQSPPNTSKIITGSGSTIYYNPWLTSDPGPAFKIQQGEQPAILTPVLSMSLSSSDLRTALWQAKEEQLQNRHGNAVDIYRSIINAGSESNEAATALVELGNVYREIKSQEVLSIIKPFAEQANPLQAVALMVLAKCYKLDGNKSAAAANYERVMRDFAGTEHEKYARLNQFFLHLNSKEYDSANSELATLQAKYPTDEMTTVASWFMQAEGVASDEEQQPKQIYIEKHAVSKNLEVALENYPNPFNPSTQIRYNIKDAGYVSLKVYDLLGREVAVLVNEEKQPGAYSVEWNAGHLPSGMYFSRLESGGRAIIQKLLLVR